MIALALAGLASAAGITPAAAPATASATPPDYIGLVRSAVVDICTFKESLAMPRDHARFGLTPAGDGAEGIRYLRTFDKASVHIWFTRDPSCKVLFDGPDRIAARDAVLQKLLAPTGGFVLREQRPRADGGDVRLYRKARTAPEAEYIKVTTAEGKSPIVIAEVMVVEE